MKVIDNNNVTEEVNKYGRLWKVWSLPETVRGRCSELPRTFEVSIVKACFQLEADVPENPNHDGLIMFVLASPKGLISGFEIFQTKATLISAIRNLQVKTEM